MPPAGRDRELAVERNLDEWFSKSRLNPTGCVEGPPRRAVSSICSRRGDSTQSSGRRLEDVRVRRLLEPIDDGPTAEYEARYYEQAAS
jgi:hypothetical protein